MRCIARNLRQIFLKFGSNIPICNTFEIFIGLKESNNFYPHFNNNNTSPIHFSGVLPLTCGFYRKPEPS